MLSRQIVWGRIWRDNFHWSRLPAAYMGGRQGFARFILAVELPQFKIGSTNFGADTAEERAAMRQLIIHVNAACSDMRSFTAKEVVYWQYIGMAVNYAATWADYFDYHELDQNTRFLGRITSRSVSF